MEIEPEAETAWIAAQTDLDPEVVATVLAFELEHLATLGLALPPVGYRFRWYDRDVDSLPEREVAVDTRVMATECERLTGVLEADVHRIFEAELRFLESRGLA
jgi:hypothetical protein